MSGLRDDARVNVVEFICPRCGAWNSPRRVYVVLHPNKKTAECSVCAFAGLATLFIPKET